MSDINELMHKGYAFALRGSGARATIAECDRMYVSEIDILVFSTGNFSIANLGRRKKMKDKPFDGIFGHYDNEIKMDGLGVLEETKSWQHHFSGHGLVEEAWPHDGTHLLRPLQERR